jgi:hypothetical protein
MLVVDAANVVGSRPDGWWRDRAGAAARLCQGLRAAIETGRLDAPVVVVLEGAARPGAEEGDRDGLRVVHAAGSGDDTITEVVAGAADEGQAVTVVTADRELRERVGDFDAEVVGPKWLLDRV